MSLSQSSQAKERAHSAHTFFFAIQAADNPPKVANPANELPAGDGRDTTVKLCSQCHAVTSFSHLRYSKDKWDSVLDDMVSKGLNASDDDMTTVEKYLTTYLVKIESSSSSKGN
jgi:hypothetical protein